MELIYNSWTEKRLSLAKQHAGSIILSGRRGSGMFHAALDLAGFFLRTEHAAEHPDLCVIGHDGDPVRKETVLEAARLSEQEPVCGRKRVFIFDDAELLSAECQNVLLKTLEERLLRNVFIFVTHMPLLDTVESRSVKVDFLPVPKERLTPFREIPYYASAGTPGAYRELSEDEGFCQFLGKLPKALRNRKDLFRAMGVLNEKDYKDGPFLVTAERSRQEYLLTFLTEGLRAALLNKEGCRKELPAVFAPFTEFTREKLLHMLSACESLRKTCRVAALSKADVYIFLMKLSEEV